MDGRLPRVLERRVNPDEIDRTGEYLEEGYPAQWFGWTLGCFGELARHVRFVHRRSRKLARMPFHGMLRFGPGLEKKQAFLFRAMETGMELFTMLAVTTRARYLTQREAPTAAAATELADGYCRAAARRIDARFDAAWNNDDARRYRFAQGILEGRQAWLEHPQLPFAEPQVDRVFESKLTTPEAAE